MNTEIELTTDIPNSQVTKAEVENRIQEKLAAASQALLEYPTREEWDADTATLALGKHPSKEEWQFSIVNSFRLDRYFELILREDSKITSVFQLGENL